MLGSCDSWKQGTTEVKINSTTSHLRMFVLGLVNRARNGIPDTGFNFNQKKDKSQTMGRACFDMEVYLKCAWLFDLDDAKNFTSKDLWTGSGSKRLNVRLRSLTGMEQKQVADNIAGIISTIVEDFARSTRIAEIFNGVKYYPSQLVPRLVKKVKKKKINKKSKTLEVKLVPIHLSRPSTIIESVTKEEKDILKQQEGPWNDMKMLCERAKKGIAHWEIDDFDKAYKSLYQKQSEITAKLSGWRKSRRMLFDEFRPPRSRSGPYKRKDADKLLSYVCSPETNRNNQEPEPRLDLVSNLLPIHLEKALGVQYDSKIASFLTIDAFKLKGYYERLEIAQVSNRVQKYLSWIPKGSFLDKHFSKSYAEERHNDSLEIRRKMELAEARHLNDLTRLSSDNEILQKQLARRQKKDKRTTAATPFTVDLSNSFLTDGTDSKGS
jgi:hypothetical protein